LTTKRGKTQDLNGLPRRVGDPEGGREQKKESNNKRGLRVNEKTRKKEEKKGEI